MNSMLTTLKSQLMADKKKSAILGGLLCVLVVVLIRALAAGGSAPELANAAPAPRPAAAPPSQTMRPVVERISTPPAAKSTAPAVVVQPPAKRRTVAAGKLPRDLKRDLFMTEDWSKYPIETAEDLQGDALKGPDFWTNLSGAMRRYARQRREDAEALSKELGELQLQSTLTGGTPLAYISGHLVKKGDCYAGFLVVRIEERRVLLEKNGQLHELVMR
ncbi:MAG TPA: hypothetical protein VMV81_13145 [Phycisphaerae bacterium]|nr:hypothetical protein [Phycisphaerae bacterium]